MLVVYIFTDKAILKIQNNSLCKAEMQTISALGLEQGEQF